MTSNSKIASHQNIPLVNSEAKSGSHIIGRGFLKWESFLNPYWYHDQNFVRTFISRKYPTIFFIRTFAPMMIRKLIPAVYAIGMSSNETLIARTNEAKTIMKISVSDFFVFIFY